MFSLISLVLIHFISFHLSLFIHLFIYSFVHSFIHYLSFICLFIVCLISFVISLFVCFLNLFSLFFFLLVPQHHYTVREIAVTGRCDCKGHADGNHCPFNQSTGLRACQCQGNTCGVQCDQCCPLFNQFLWKPGSGAPWTNDPTVKCERKFKLREEC